MCGQPGRARHDGSDRSRNSRRRSRPRPAPDAVPRHARSVLEELTRLSDRLDLGVPELALHLNDAVVRRTEAGSAGHPGRAALAAACGLLAAAHGWDETRQREEMAQAEAVYRIGE